MYKSFVINFVLMSLVLTLGCKEEPRYEWREMTVKASAYNSVVNQTNSNPYITAFGDSLIPGLKYIAVSRDLLNKGLRHNTPVRIEGLEGLYLVKDKMNKRYTNHIDIYMGLDLKAAKNWGRKSLKIHYQVPLVDSIRNAN